MNQISPTASVSLPVTGMTCAACATRIEKVLGRAEGVEGAAVNLASEAAEVRFDPARTDPIKIAEAIRKAGFGVPTRTIELTITGMTCAACATRIERVLGRLPGVTQAQVNLATEKAYVETLPGAIEPVRLVEAVTKAGYGATLVIDPAEQAARDDAVRRKAEKRERFMLVGAALLTTPLVAQMLFEVFGLHWMLPPWGQLLLATPVQFVFGWRFYTGAYKSLRGGAGNMDVLVALGTTAAYGLSLWMMLGTADGHLYFEAASVVVTLVLLGKWLEGRAKRSAASAIKALMALKPEKARVERDGVVVEVPADAVRLGEIVLIRPHERVPVDGVVVEGESHMDEALLTGESLPVPKGLEDAVTGGAINGDGLLRVRATAVGAGSTISRIIKLVEGAQASKAPVQRLVDRISAIFVPVVVVIAVLTFVGWWLMGGGVEQALVAAISVLVIACPCALGLATPTGIMVGTGVAARHGILIKDAEALELAHRANAVIFDKTGTLTLGKPAVTDVVAVEGDRQALMRLAASAQQGSEHPLAHAVLDGAAGMTLSPVSEFRSLAGRGLSATVDGHELLIGSPRLMAEQNIDLAGLATQAEALEGEGRTVMWVAEQGRALGLLAVADPVKPEAIEAVRRLHALGVETVMLTGDNKRAAAHVARQVGIDRVLAEVLPQDKAAEVQRLKAEGKVVAMVGDGVNDAPALAAADVGLAMGTGTDIAMETAGITLMRGDPSLVPAALSISSATYRKIRQNLFWAFVYNVVALPAAALGMLNPVVAGAAMAMSSVSVVSNALLLRRWKGEGR